MPNDSELLDSVLILYNDAKDREDQNLFGRYRGEMITHSISPMSITFDLPSNAEVHRGKSFTHVYAHSQIKDLRNIFPGVPVTHFSIALVTWYSQAIDKIKNIPRTDTDKFIETVLEWFKKIVPSDFRGIAKHYLTIHERQLKLHEQNFTEFLKKTYRLPEDARKNETSVIDYFKSLTSDEIKAAHAKVLAVELPEIIGKSKPVKEVEHLIARAAEENASLLIRGESGTGKELVAKAVHFASPRRSKPFICLNCAAIAESLQESELFGHEKGAFTGATEMKTGKFEAAHTGTIFLDEIGEMPLTLQAKLLRVLEKHPFERVGGHTPIKVDVRLIAATNRDLEKEVTEGRFREDLFFRLCVLEIVVPPLRERTDDISILANHFLGKLEKENRKYQGFSQEAMNKLLEHRWSGNVRELKNVVERAVVFGSPPQIQVQDLLLSALKPAGDIDRPLSTYSQPSANDFIAGFTFGGVVRSKEDDIVAKLRETNPNVRDNWLWEWVVELQKYEHAYNESGEIWEKAAELLGENKRTLINHRNNIGEEIKKNNLTPESLDVLSRSFPNATKKPGGKIWSEKSDI